LGSSGRGAPIDTARAIDAWRTDGQRIEGPIDSDRAEMTRTTRASSVPARGEVVPPVHYDELSRSHSHSYSSSTSMSQSPPSSASASPAVSPHGSPATSASPLSLFSQSLESTFGARQ